MSGTNKGRVIMIQETLKSEGPSLFVRNLYDRLKKERSSWEAEKRELRNYIFATDTTKTTNNTDNWRNKTTYPKICQIRDNLFANYLSSLFSTDRWFVWEGTDSESVTKKKRTAIEAYMRQKTEESRFRDLVSSALYDYIDYGNVIGDVVYVNESRIDQDTGAEVVDYTGPLAIRVSPMDMVFQLDAATFERSAKITRYVKNFGELERDAEMHPEWAFDLSQIAKLKDHRRFVHEYSQNDLHKAVAYQIDGFGDLKTYYGSGLIELLIFEGDYYDSETSTLHKNRRLVIADRNTVLSDTELNTWTGKSTMRHAGWRKRPDNLMAMGPLDNLVGLQYRIDHLENMKADLFDLIANPPLKISGNVSDFQWRPKEHIYVGDEGDVTAISVPDTVLNADLQIAELERRMEELAGAPKNAMGFRTPGEKTKFEVQSLDNAASRIFDVRIAQFEDTWLEPMLNNMLEVARRNIDGAEEIKLLNEEGLAEFMTITRDDLKAVGRIRPRGSRHARTRALAAQNASQMLQNPFMQDETVIAHLSGKAIAEMFQDILELDRYGLVRENARVEEQMAIAQAQQAAQQVMQQSQQGLPEGTLPPEEAPE